MVHIFDLSISTFNLEETSKLIIKWAQQEKRKYVLACSMNDLVWTKRSKKVLSSLLKADLVTADGMSIVWTARWLKKKKIERVYGPDLLLKVCQKTEKRGVSHYFYGNTKLVLKKLVKKLKTKLPQLKITGFYSPPFRQLTELEENQFFRKIKEKKPDIVWVGLGCPKQNIWARRASKKLHPCVIVGVGAAFDFIAGSKKQAPLWMQNSGLEWFYRFAQEPRRLWKRYILGIPIFIYLLIKKELKRERDEME